MSAAALPVELPCWTERAGRWWRRYGLAAIGVAIIAGWSAAAILAPLIAPHRPNAVDLAVRLLPPSPRHLAGTDALGRDVFSRLLFGARISLVTGIIVTGIGGLIGTIIGGTAAYAGRAVEWGLMRFTDLVFCFPPLILALAIGAALGVGTTNTIIAILIVWWPKYARLAQSLVLQQRTLEYVEAAQVAGYGGARILFRHIIPNAIGPLIVLLTLDIGNAILTFAGLSFLGLGVVPPTPEWGSMVASGIEYVSQWWVAAIPGFAILSVVLGFNFVGDGIRDWLDPKAIRR